MVNPNAFATGYACWGDGEMIDAAMAIVTDEPIVKSELAVHPKPWAVQVGLQLVCISGEDVGVQVKYTATSVGGKKAYTALLDELLKQAQSGSPDIVPVVELDFDSYKHKKYGKVFTPVFKLVEWQSMDAMVTASVDDEDDEVEEIEEVVEEKPKRRTRKRA